MKVLVLLLLAFALTGMSRSEAPGVSQPTPTIPVLLPVSLSDLTAVERPPANGFEYALRESDWPVNDWSIIRSIVQCESGFDRLAVGGAGELGALQIHPRAHPDLARTYDLSTYEGSLSAAMEVHDEAVEMGRAGFSPWACWGGAE